MTTIKVYQFLEGFDTSRAGYKFITKVVSIPKAIYSIIVLWNQRSTDRRQLANLNDRMLQDIGITRSEVDCEIKKYIWQE